MHHPSLSINGPWTARTTGELGSAAAVLLLLTFARRTMSSFPHRERLSNRNAHTTWRSSATSSGQISSCRRLCSTNVTGLGFILNALNHPDVYWFAIARNQSWRWLRFNQFRCGSMEDSIRK